MVPLRQCGGSGHSWTSRWSFVHWAPSATCWYTLKTHYHWTSRRGLCTPYLVTDDPRCTLDRLGRTLRHRLTKHRRTLKNGAVAASALAKHTLDTGHPLDLTKAEVIDHHPHTMMGCLLEIWPIQKNQGTLNREKGTLPEVYKALLE